jgi:hypothetical protein
MKTRAIAAAVTLTTAIAVACEQPPTSPPLPSANPQIDKSVWMNAYNQFVPIPTFSHFIPCAAGGDGEVVDFTGRFHLVLHHIITPSGHVTRAGLFQSQWLKGIGRTTGDTYQGSWFSTGAMTYRGTSARQSPFVLHMHFVGPGPGNDFFEWITIQFHVNANGVVTVDEFKESTDCK